MSSKCNSQAGQLACARVQSEQSLRQRILVVDDDLLIRKLNAQMLIFSGYDVDTAENGAVAWHSLQLNRYDLLVTDNEMPKVSGLELLKKVHATRLALPAIMATGKFPLEVFTRHPWLRPAVTLLKPYTFNELVGAVQIVLLATTGAGGESASPSNRPASRQP
jgi:DNA-binding NtrC family response regulator